MIVHGKTNRPDGVEFAYLYDCASLSREPVGHMTITTIFGQTFVEEYYTPKHKEKLKREREYQEEEDRLYEESQGEDQC